MQLPNFDQWLDPATQKPESQQATPSVEDLELDQEIAPTDPDPTIPFIMFLHAGARRIGEVGHYVRMLTKKKVRVVSIDTKRKGYSHNILLPRVLAWIKHLALLTLCIAIIISGPCSPWTPLAMEKTYGGRSVLFDKSHADGIKAHDGSPHPLVEAALELHSRGLDVARIAHGHVTTSEICRCVGERKARYETGDSRRSNQAALNLRFYWPVCRRYLLSTSPIGEDVVHNGSPHR